jgi:hypothetical protein
MNPRLSSPALPVAAAILLLAAVPRAPAAEPSLVELLRSAGEYVQRPTSWPRAGSGSTTAETAPVGRTELMLDTSVPSREVGVATSR